jgi:phosphate transport system substrate-binding protein
MRTSRLHRVCLLLAVFLIAAVVAAGCSPSGGGGVKELSGAGATFPYPLYSKMFDVYESVSAVRVNYNGIGSGGGIKALTDKTVDFGASDAFLTDEEEQAMGGPVLHIPTCIGAVVLSYNLDGNPDLKLDSAVIAGIFMGSVRNWNDPAIAGLNPGVTLPDLAVTVVHRSDGSGTTSIFTNYLSMTSPAWKEKVGAGKSVAWPAGIGGKGNDGVAGLVKQNKGSIGYIELVYAIQTGMPYATVLNAAGTFVTPTLATVAAAANVQLPADLRVLIVNSPESTAYPLSAFTWILVYQEQHYADRSLDQARALKNLLTWMLGDGQQVNEGLSYGRLPEAAVTKARALLSSMTYDGTPVR